MAGAGLRAQDKPKEAPPSKPTAGEVAKDSAKKEEAKDSKDEKKSVSEHAIMLGGQRVEYTATAVRAARQRIQPHRRDRSGRFLKSAVVP